MISMAARRALVRRGGLSTMSTTTRKEPASCESMLDIGSRRLFNNDHDLFRETCRKFFADKVVPHHAQWEDAGKVSKEVWQQAGQAGLLGVTMPEEYGGAGADILSASVLWEEQSYSGCTGPGFSIHSEINLPYLLHYGTETQKQKYLPNACNGDLITAIAMTEPGAGSDLQGVATNAVKDGDDWILNGSKVFITNGQMADLIIVVAKTDLKAKRAAHGLTLLLVDSTMPGFARGKNLKKLGMKAQDTSELFFDNVRVSSGNVLGEINKGFYYLMTELPQERLLIAGLGIATAEACYEWTRAHVKQRKAFGGALSDLQTVRHKLAELKTEIAVARAFYDRCLELHAEKQLDNQMASMAKLHCTELQNSVATRWCAGGHVVVSHVMRVIHHLTAGDARAVANSLQLHGGWGYMLEYPIARAFVDSRVQPIYGGANEIMKELISRTI